MKKLFSFFVAATISAASFAQSEKYVKAMEKADENNQKYLEKLIAEALNEILEKFV